MGNKTEELKMEDLKKNVMAEIEADEYKVYYYLKKHPGLLVSFVSAFTIVISFMCNLALYANENRYLKYWGIESSYVTVNTTQQIYIIIISCMFFYIGTISTQAMISLYEKHYSGAEAFLCFKRGVKILEKGIRRFKHRDKEELWCDKIQQVERTLSRSKKKIKSTKKIFYRRLYSNVCAVAIPAALLIYILLWLGGSDYNVWQMILYAGGSTIVTVIILPYLYKALPMKRRIFKKAKKIYSDIDSGEAFEELNNSIELKYPLERLMDLSLKEFFSKSSIFVASIYTLLIPVYIVIILMTMNRDVTVDKKDFLITVKNGQEYALIYNDGKNYYLEEAEIKKTHIIINTEEFRVVSDKDIKFEVREFEEVVRK